VTDTRLLLPRGKRRRSRGWGLRVLAVVALASAGTALAQTPLDDPLDDHSARRLDRMEKVVRELRAIVFQGRETGAPVVVQPAETDSRISGISDRLNDLDHTLTRVNGELEVIRHDIDEARHENADLTARNASLATRLDADEKTLAAMTAPPPPPPPPDAPPAPAAASDAAGAFAAARALFAAGDNTGAEAALHDFVDRFGDSPRGPEARYLLAKTLIARHDWPEAATADIGAIRGWPRTRWAPDAVLDLARALTAMQKPADACQTLDELGRRYPKAAPQIQSGATSLRGQAKCG